MKLSAEALDAKIARLLRSTRKKRRWSMEAVGHELGITHQMVARYEKGKNRISASTLYRALGVLEVEPSWFFETLDLDEEVAPADHPPSLSLAS